MKCPKFTLKEVDLHKWCIFFRDSLIGETSFPVPSEKIGKCIVQAINNYELHKKLVAMLEQYQTDEFWTENPKLAIDTLVLALKESESH